MCYIEPSVQQHASTTIVCYKTAVSLIVLCALVLLKDLIAELKSELSGNFSHTITSLCKSPAERDADELRKAMKVAFTISV